MLVTLPVTGGSITTRSISGGEDARCFILYATPTDGTSSLHCLSEVDTGTLSTTELRSVDRLSGKSTIISSKLMPCYSPLGPAVYDDERGVVIALYFYSPCAQRVETAQGDYLITLNESTGKEVAIVAITDGTRFIQLMYDGVRKLLYAVAEVGASAAVYVGTVDSLSAEFTPLPSCPNFQPRFAYFSTNTAATLSSGGLDRSIYFAATTETLVRGPPVTTPWLVAVNAMTGELIYESPSDGPTTFSLLAWAPVNVTLTS